ncbi:hypothetical protein [Vannielia litorea]|uniref:hypothetical protein n=1 Tax=Vannielia litorea TaxID=1217970 RepID=UPI001BCD0063|nr:hypothetical protein [Vannielia litorea]MBS8228171.1 hypothetical protein [Vannielia litorea]
MVHLTDVNHLRRILRTLEEVGPDAQFMRLRAAAVEEGGYYKPARLNDEWDSGRIEIKVRGVFASGDTPERVVDEWQRGARDMLDRHRAVSRAVATLHRRDDDTRPELIVSACDTIIAFDTGPMIEMARRIKREIRLPAG